MDASLKEKFPVIFAQFPGEIIEDMQLRGDILIVLTDKNIYAVEKNGTKTELTDYR